MHLSHRVWVPGASFNPHSGHRNWKERILNSKLFTVHLHLDGTQLQGKTGACALQEHFQVKFIIHLGQGTKTRMQTDGQVIERVKWCRIHGDDRDRKFLHLFWQLRPREMFWVKMRMTSWPVAAQLNRPFCEMSCRRLYFPKNIRPVSIAGDSETKMIFLCGLELLLYIVLMLNKWPFY